MLNSLSALPSLAQITAWVVIGILMTYLLMMLIHRVIPFTVRHKHNEVVGFVIAVVGVFYALIMASVLVIAINHFDRTQDVVEKEANLVGDVVRHAKAISPQIAVPVAELAKKYLEEIIAKEWPAQKEGKKTVFGLQTLTELSLFISGYTPRDQRESAYYSMIIQKMTELYDVRRDRIFRADEGIAWEIWAVTLAGGILTVCFVLLFGIEHQKMHFFLASILSVAITLILALIAIFDAPFQGDMSISDAPYKLVREQIDLS